jgi:hypothetical protein
VSSAITNWFQSTLRGWLLAFGIAFRWIVEVCVLLSALLEPLAVGGLLLPVGQKIIFAYGKFNNLRFMAFFC